MHSILKASLPLMLILPACGAKSSKDVADNVTSHTELEGNWKDACHAPNPVAQAFKAGFIKDSYDFGYVQNGFKRIQSSFSDQGCAQAVYSLELAGTYQVINDGPDIDAARPINFKLDKAVITPQNADVVSLMNAGSFCDQSDWALNQPKEVTNKKCGLLQYKNGDVVFDIYKVENKQLTLGKTSTFIDNSSGTTRPTERAKDLPYSR